MRKINEFFFPLEVDEELSMYDAVWFYGLLGASFVLTAIVVGVTM